MKNETRKALRDIIISFIEILSTVGFLFSFFMAMFPIIFQIGTKTFQLIVFLVGIVLTFIFQGIYEAVTIQLYLRGLRKDKKW